jgi:hypothetical protein
MRIFLLGVALLAGCSSQPGTGAYEATRGGTDYAGGNQPSPPEMVPDRKVSEQDCSKPVDYSLGNIRCK